MPHGDAYAARSRRLGSVLAHHFLVTAPARVKSIGHGQVLRWRSGKLLAIRVHDQPPPPLG